MRRVFWKFFHRSLTRLGFRLNGTPNIVKKWLMHFFEYGKLKAIPTQRKKERIVLEVIAQAFEYARIYTEREVNIIIADFHDDFCTIRRDMVGEQLLDRDARGYWLFLYCPPPDLSKKPRPSIPWMRMTASSIPPVRIFFSMPINKSLSDRWIFIGRHTMKNMYE